MSLTTARLVQRPLSTIADAASSRLSELRPGGSGVVQGYDAALDGAVARRLHDLGFVPGARVEVVRRAPLRDPLIYRVADYDIALRRVQAAAIVIESTAA